MCCALLFRFLFARLFAVCAVRPRRGRAGDYAAIDRALVLYDQGHDIYVTRSCDLHMALAYALTEETP